VAKLINNKTVDTPIKVNARYSSSDSLPLTDHMSYHTIVECLVYLTITRPNIAYVVHVVSQFVVSPTIVYWAAVLRILRCLWGIIFQSLLLPSIFSLELCAYSDVDHGSNPTNHMFVTSLCIFLGDSFVSW
jgi:hypothetical protein